MHFVMAQALYVLVLFSGPANVLRYR